MIKQREVLASLVATAKATISGIKFITDVDTVGEYPYTVIYLIEGGGYSGPAWFAPEGDAHMVIQASHVGDSVDQVLHLADDFREMMLGRDADGQLAVSIPGVTGRLPYGGPPGTLVEGEPGERVYNLPERFVLQIVNTE